MDDERLMRKAIALAERGRGRTSPNPMVGALVVDADGVIVGRGAHEFAGGAPAPEKSAAEGGGGRRSANPMVGALVVDADGVIVGRGAHEFAGGPHAEINALAEAGDR